LFSGVARGKGRGGLPRAAVRRGGKNAGDKGTSHYFFFWGGAEFQFDSGAENPLYAAEFVVQFVVQLSICTTNHQEIELTELGCDTLWLLCVFGSDFVSTDPDGQ